MKKALDLFCGAGGATRGLQRAGFTVAGVDIYPQPHYCGDFFVETDAMTWPFEHGEWDLIWASPPCQAYTNAQRIQGNNHPRLIDPLRERLVSSGFPFVIENVPGAPLRNPVLLCGAQFGLKVYRHRLFETSFPVRQPEHPDHVFPLAKMGRPVTDHEFMHVVGNFSGVSQARTAMGIDWMVRDELSEAIPPVYAEYIARQLLTHTEASVIAPDGTRSAGKAGL